MPSDKILISELEVAANIGCSEEERANKQRLTLSLELWLDLKRAATTKDLNDSVCYFTLSNKCSELISGKPWILIEELAEEIAELALSRHPQLKAVKVLVKKYVIKEMAWAGVEILRERKA